MMYQEYTLILRTFLHIFLKIIKKTNKVVNAAAFGCMFYCFLYYRKRKQTSSVGIKEYISVGGRIQRFK